VATHLFQLAQNSFLTIFGNLLFLAVFTFGAILRAQMKVFQDQGYQWHSKGMIEPPK
jgi:hypothetical protein